MVRLEWYDEKVCDCEARYDREVDPSVCAETEPFGVEVTLPEFVRLMRAVSGVGALICDFFGVSPTLERLDELSEDAIDLELVGAGVAILERRPPRINGCRSACWGFRRRSGSQVRHFAMKSTKSSSSQRSTWARVLVPGRLRLPLEFTTGLATPLGSRQSQSAPWKVARNAFAYRKRASCVSCG